MSSSQGGSHGNSAKFGGGFAYGAQQGGGSGKIMQQDASDSNKGTKFGGGFAYGAQQSGGSGKTTQQDASNSNKGTKSGGGFAYGAQQSGSFSWPKWLGGNGKKPSVTPTVTGGTPVSGAGGALQGNSV